MSLSHSALVVVAVCLIISLVVVWRRCPAGGTEGATPTTAADSKYARVQIEQHQPSVAAASTPQRVTSDDGNARESNSSSADGDSRGTCTGSEDEEATSHHGRRAADGSSEEEVDEKAELVQHV